MQCKHYKGEGYNYDIGDEEDLYLCDQCNLNLAEKIMGQLVIQVFSQDFNMEVKQK